MSYLSVMLTSLPKDVWIIIRHENDAHLWKSFPILCCINSSWRLHESPEDPCVKLWRFAETYVHASLASCKKASVSTITTFWFSEEAFHSAAKLPHKHKLEDCSKDGIIFKMCTIGYSQVRFHFSSTGDVLRVLSLARLNRVLRVYKLVGPLQVISV